MQEDSTGDLLFDPVVLVEYISTMITLKPGDIIASEPAAADGHHRAPTGTGTLYLCAVKDACTNRIVGYSMDARMTSQLAVTALRNAAALRSRIGTTVHSDRGSQCRSHAYIGALRQYGLAGSMGRVGACADNAAIESFFQPAAEERPQPPPMGVARGAPPRDRHLDRTHLPPPATRRPTRPTHTHRVRDTRVCQRDRGRPLLQTAHAA